jgi:hypothetical protein
VGPDTVSTGQETGRYQPGEEGEMAYDPRTDTGLPTEPVGSLPRPAKLQAAYAQYDEGKIEQAELEALQDEAVKDSIQNHEAAGSPIVSDGESAGRASRPIPSLTLCRTRD